MKHLVSMHAASAWPDGAIGDVHRALDDFNDAAAKADEDRYFGLFAPEATFLGTDTRISTGRINQGYDRQLETLCHLHLQSICLSFSFFFFLFSPTPL
ncbi:MAG: nuclear transport factor 2 family protein [Planctomycetes bacterium]|nr:nuclear transport factor 2 family protein [Planctomycetota bacterium]